MPRRLTVILLLITHATALFAGWAVFSRTALFPSESPPSHATPPSAKTAPREPAATWSAAGILREVDQALAAAGASSPSRDPLAESGDVQALRQELTTSGTTARTAFEDLLSEIASRDQFIVPGENPPPIDYERLNALLAILARDHGPLSLAAYLGRAPLADPAIARAIGAELTRDPSLEKLTAIKAAISPVDWSIHEDEIIHAWPVARLDDLLSYALAEDRPRLLIGGSDGNGQHRAVWLARVIADDSLPAAFRSVLRDSAEVQELIAHSPDLPVAAHTEAQPGFSPFGFGFLDVEQFLERPEDWAYRFQTGQATPEELLAALSAATPQLAATHPGELRQALYFKLSEIDPADALTLLADLPASQRGSFLLSIANSGAYGGKPDQFLTLLSQIPDTPETRDQRLLAWQERSTRYLNISTGDYLRWLDSLPPGLDRDLALSTAAARLQSSDAAQAAELRQRIADPAIEQNTDLLR